MRALAVGVLWAVGSWITERESDLLSSPLWVWGWVLVPVAALALARTGDEHPVVLGAGLCAPMAVAFIAHGDPAADPGPSSWPIGVLLCLALAGICTAAALGVSRRAEHHHGGPDDAKAERDDAATTE